MGQVEEIVGHRRAVPGALRRARNSLRSGSAGRGSKVCVAFTATGLGSKFTRRTRRVQGSGHVLRLISIVTAALWLAASTARAAELSFAIGHPPQSYVVLGGKAFAEVLKTETGGAVTARIHSMSLLSMAETSSGLREGLADIGAVLPPYHAAEYPDVNLVHETSMALDRFGGLPRGLEGAAFAGATAEFILLGCPQCNAEFARQNQVYTGALATTPYTLNCNRPVVGLEDLRGARLRVGGANWARWAVALGATPVALAGDEMLQALSMGLLDCIVLDVPDVATFGLSGGIRSITADVPGGVFVVAFANVNRDVWHGLTRPQRTAFMKAVARGTAVANWAFREGEAVALARQGPGSITILEAAPEVRDATARFVRDDLENLARSRAASQRTRDAEMLRTFLDVLSRWADLVRDVASADDLERVYWTEVYSKVDVDRHGF